MAVAQSPVVSDCLICTSIAARSVELLTSQGLVPQAVMATNPKKATLIFLLSSRSKLIDVLNELLARCLESRVVNRETNPDASRGPEVYAGNDGDLSIL